MATDFEHPQTKRNIALMEVLATSSAGSAEYKRAQHELVAENERLIAWVAARLRKRFRVPNDEMDELTNRVRFVLVSQIRKWPPLVISLQMFLLYRSAEDARGWVQSSTGYGAAVCALRRLHRYNRYRAHLIDVLGPDVDDDTVIEYANADARRTYANPVKSAILLERDEILKSQAMFGDSMEITDRVVSIALDVDDADVLVHSSESAEFLVGLLRVVHEQAGLEVAKVFGYRMSIDLGLEEAGHLRPMREVATLSGLSAAVCRAHLDVATKVAGDFLHSSERSAMPV